MMELFFSEIRQQKVALNMEKTQFLKSKYDIQ